MLAANLPVCQYAGMVRLKVTFYKNIYKSVFIQFLLRKIPMNKIAFYFVGQEACGTKLTNVKGYLSKNSKYEFGIRIQGGNFECIYKNGPRI